jgi:acetyl-CoA acetyltransferase
MHDYGATEEQLAAVAVAQSAAAALNPLAVYRDPLSLDDYLSAPYVIAPLRRFDFCMISDGAFATVVMSEARARDLPKLPIGIESIGFQCSFLEDEHPDAMYHPSQLANAKRLWGGSDLTPADIDAIYIQDAFSPNVLAALENYGFCDRGTAHEWIQGGRIALGGELPVNPHGGQSRMTYMVGWQNTFDAVKQLRGEAENTERQIADCSNVLSTISGGHWQETFSMILTR